MLEKAILPTLLLTGNVGTSSNTLSKLTDPDYLAASILTAIAQPIFVGGQIKHQERLQELVVEEQFIQYHRVVLSAFQEVENLLANERFLAQRLVHLKHASEQAEAAETLAQERYVSGLTPFLQVLDAQQRSLDAAGQLLSIRLAAVVNRINLIKALGGDLLKTPASFPAE